MNDLKPGPTGRTPKGVLQEDDQGEFAAVIGVDKKKNIMYLNFGTPIMWFAMNREQAKILGTALLEHAKELREADA